jgi:gliding motility-associated-like protein
VDTVAPSDTTTYSVTVTDTTCAVSDSLVLLVYPPSSIDITLPDTTVCGGGSIAITNTYGAPGVNTWTWDPPLGVSNPLDPNPVITPVGTTYYLTGSDPYGCEHTDSIKIGVVNFNLSIWQDSTICLGDSLVLGLQIPGGSGGGYTVQWWDPSGGFISDPFIRNPMVLPRVTTTYTATVTDTASGCQETISTDVTVIILQIQASPGSITINPGQSVQMQATGGVRYLWDPDTTINCIVCPDPVAAPGNSTLYTVTGWDIHGCTATATVNIATDSLLVPNVFTPNGDGVNDVLLFNYHGSAFYQISIYDRWGKMIYSTTDRNAMWDGRTSAGGDAPESVYYVAVRIVGDAAIPDKDKQKVFPVTLIR